MINYLETHPGIGYTEVANIFSVNRRTLSKIHKKYKESRVIEDDKGGGPRSTKVQDIHLERIEREIEENPTTILKEIKILLFEEFQLAITEKNGVKSHLETRNHQQTNVKSSSFEKY
ncbi:hypothetical protein RF11_01963 [Thelohanellus kitauei]|uniref:Uncharacterized protein n=1 Tax=Thelohanellus kitauei TaxID=669202 RepID=A0A0C2N249_THEKT|nr:hypothetical protein RF11_01963 [Thelohanellus kitauei]